MPRPYLFLAFLFLAASSASAQPSSNGESTAADCRVRISAVPAGWFIQGYDPFDKGIAEATFSATFVNEGGGDCRFTPVFQLDQPPFGLSKGSEQPIRYALLNLTDAQDVTPRGGRTQRMVSQAQITLAPHEMRSVLYKLVANPDDVTSAGTFSQDVTLEAQDESFRILGRTRVVLGVNVLPSARIGLAGAFTVNNGRAVVDLGELSEGIAPVLLQLRVSSTGRYDIGVTSANSGRLRLGSTEWVVPYSVLIGGHAVNLSGTNAIAGLEGTKMQKNSLPVQFVIGDVSNRRAGKYSDVISIFVTAR